MTTITRTASPPISTSSVVSLRDNWKQWPPELRQEFLTRLEDNKAAELNRRFRVHCHDHQLPPEIGNNGEPWTTWLLIGGRGAGKTRAGAEWVKSLANAPRQDGETDRRIALIGQTEHETREVMIEGVSGLLAVHPRHARPLWSPTRRRLEWNNGAIAQAFSAEDPESLRGPQFSAAWADELAKWRHAEATFDMLQFDCALARGRGR